MRPSLRDNALPLLTVAVLLVTLALVAFLIDVQYYQPAKKNLVVEEYFKRHPIYSQFLKSFVERYVVTREPEKARELAGDIRAAVEHEVFHEGSPIIAVEIVRDDQTLLQVYRTDYKPVVSFNNSLLRRDFRGVTTSVLPPVDDAYESAWISATYTTPPGFQPVIELTRRYRLILIGAVLAICLLYYVLLRFLILPVRNVSQAIQRSESRPAVLIAKPHSRLESLYNRMARDALLAELETGLAQATSRRLRVKLSDLCHGLDQRVRQWFGFAAMGIADVDWQGPERLRVSRILPNGPEESGRRQSLSATVEKALTETVVRGLRTSWESDAPKLVSLDLPGEGGVLHLGALRRVEEEGVHRIFALLRSEGLESERREWADETAHRLYLHVSDIIESRILQSRELFREKSEANINLSRNLGHDLTNIIATNKLELMTVSQLLKRDPDEWLQDADVVEVVRESLTRLLDNTRSLQEIVNLYRAYEYLKSPRYEETDLTETLRQVIEIFRLSMSTAAEIVFEPDAATPAVRAEPRLIKLAVFNLLGNAQDAIRSLPADRQATARIFVKSFWQAGKNEAVVQIADSGPGIRNSAGDPAHPEEIAHIFELGYTTKTGGQGEGLGLNWVRTILTEFHGGELTARNAGPDEEPTGAIFEFTLPGDGTRP